jgi:hypothetical protein
MMHHFPHIYVMQMEMKKHQEHLKQQEAMASATGTEREQLEKERTKLAELDALKQSGVLNMLSSPDGRVKIQSLASRVQESKGRLEESVSQWSAEKKEQFFQSFVNHPSLANLSSLGNDPIAKINMFLDMPQEDLDQMMTLLVVISCDGGGKLLNQLRDPLAPLEGDSSGSAASRQMMNGIVATMGSLTKFSKFGPPPSANSSQHRGNHVHNHSCSADGQVKPPDVSSGKSASMDR